MTAEAPIDVDDFMSEKEDLYGEQVKTKPCDDSSSDEVEIFDSPSKKSRLAYRKPYHRRHPEDAELQDRILVNLVNEGWSWELVLLSFDLTARAIAKEFPGTEMSALKARHFNMKAKTMRWSEEAVSLYLILTDYRILVFNNSSTNMILKSGRRLLKKWVLV
jgi:hypothetical protein